MSFSPSYLATFFTAEDSSIIQKGHKVSSTQQIFLLIKMLTKYVVKCNVQWFDFENNQRLVRWLIEFYEMSWCLSNRQMYEAGYVLSFIYSGDKIVATVQSSHKNISYPVTVCKIFKIITFCLSKSYFYYRCRRLEDHATTHVYFPYPFWLA